MADLAARLGYFDQSHFSKAFQSLTGEAPGQYRDS
jgi:AraC-like DNA-binding protein